MNSNPNSQNLLNLSPLDGRYQKNLSELAAIFSESGLIKTRIYVECEYLLALANTKIFPLLGEFSPAERKSIQAVYKNFSIKDAKRVKDIEAVTNHDVKAVEYFIKEVLEPQIGERIEFIHFGLTSEDVNSTSYALMLKEGVETVIIPQLKNILSLWKKNALRYKGLAFPARTHGQNASPTTLGKEILVFHQRLLRQIERLESQEYFGKFSGATGNFSSFLSASEELDWISFAKNFLHDLELKQNLVTTQIEPHDFVAEVCQTLQLANNILLDFSQDFWRYISDDFFKQKLKAGEVGSSAMPHKVNPIDFENAEGNIGLANALLEFLARKLPVSRLQRDLSDSTIFRNLGSSLGHMLLALKSLQRGIGKLEAQEENISKFLSSSWEVLAEPIQTILRSEGVEKPYEKLKELTRGKKITPEKINNFVKELDISPRAKEKILALRPENYIGLADQIVDRILGEK